jgi:hypothetical protein
MSASRTVVLQAVGRVLLSLLALAVLWVLLVYPELEKQAEQAPLVNAILAVRRGDVDGVRAVMLPEATIRSGVLAMPAATVLTLATPLIREYGRQTAIRFDGYRDPRRVGGTLTAEFWVWIYPERPDAPGRRIPLHRSGRVVLKRTGLLRWRIQELSSDEAYFGQIMTGREP